MNDDDPISFLLFSSSLSSTNSHRNHHHQPHCHHPLFSDRSRRVRVGHRARLFPSFSSLSEAPKPPTVLVTKPSCRATPRGPLPVLVSLARTHTPPHAPQPEAELRLESPKPSPALIAFTLAEIRAHSLRAPPCLEPTAARHFTSSMASADPHRLLLHPTSSELSPSADPAMAVAPPPSALAAAHHAFPSRRHEAEIRIRTSWPTPQPPPPERATAALRLEVGVDPHLRCFPWPRPSAA